MVMTKARHRADPGATPSHFTVRGVTARVDQDAALEGLSARWARAVFWLPTLGVPALATVYVGSKWVFYWLLREDHVVEWGQFGLLLAASLVAVVAAARFARQRRWVLATLLLFVGLTAFGMAGEEISWGQRVFDWSTPAGLQASNRQGETNLHNVDVGVPVAADQVADYVELALGLGGVALSLLARPARARFHRTVLWDLAPPLAAVPGFAWMVVYQAGTQAVELSAAPVILYQEWFELGFYAGIAVTLVAVFARAAQGRVRLVPVGRRGIRRAGPHAPAGLGPVVVVWLLSAVITAVFATLTARTGRLPGNVPGSMAT